MSKSIKLFYMNKNDFMPFIFQKKLMPTHMCIIHIEFHQCEYALSYYQI